MHLLLWIFTLFQVYVTCRRTSSEMLIRWFLECFRNGDCCSSRNVKSIYSQLSDDIAFFSATKVTYGMQFISKVISILLCEERERDFQSFSVNLLFIDHETQTPRFPVCDRMKKPSERERFECNDKTYMFIVSDYKTLWRLHSWLLQVQDDKLWQVDDERGSFIGFSRESERWEAFLY